MTYAAEHDPWLRERLEDGSRAYARDQARTREEPQPGVQPFAPPESYGDEPEAARKKTTHRSIAAPIWFRDIEPNLSLRDALGGVLGTGELSSFYGASGCGKTFLALDIAMALACNLKWRERSVQHGIVLYAAGEGRGSVEMRLDAYRRHHFGADEWPDLPFGLLPQSIDLLDPDYAHVDTVCRYAKQAEREWQGKTTVLVVIDTLARSIAGANENAPEVMSRAVESADRLREQTGAHVLLVHHTGKNGENGARGHSSLRAALDTEIEVTGLEGTRVAKVTKQRNRSIGDTFAFTLRPVAIGTNPETGEEVTSCVLEHADAAPQSGRRPPSTKNQAALLAGLKEFARGKPDAVITPSELREIAKGQGLKQYNRLAEARQALLKNGWIVETVGGLRLAEDAL